MISRLLELERLAWKVFQLYHLSPASEVQPLGYDAGILFTTISTDSLQLPARLSGYVTAVRALQPHRLQPVNVMLPEDVLKEPHFCNRQVTQPPMDDCSCQLACHKHCWQCCSCHTSDA